MIDNNYINLPNFVPDKSNNFCFVNSKNSDSDNPFDEGFKTLDHYMKKLSDDAKAYYASLDNKMKISTTDIDRVLSNIKKQLETSHTGKLESSDIKFLNENNIPLPVPNESGYDKWTEGVDYNLDQVEETVSSFKNSLTDFVAESQLKIQRIMQTYHTAATLLNSLQSMLAEINKSIIQTMR